MSTTHEPIAQHADTTTPAQRTSSGIGEPSAAQRDTAPFGIPTPRDDEDFEPTIIRGRE